MFRLLVVCLMVSTFPAYLLGYYFEFQDEDMPAALAQPEERAITTLETDVTYRRWPNPAAIPYRLDSRYSPADRDRIRTAMDNVQAGVTITAGQPCIVFVPYVNATHFNQPHLYIGPMTTPTANPDRGVAFATCFSYSGLKNPATPPYAQKLGLVNGTDGCLDNVRAIMKYLVNAVGLRDEWKRPDRDTYVTAVAANVRTNIAATDPTGPMNGEDYIRPYRQVAGTPLGGAGGTITIPTGQVSNVFGLTFFDYDSITLPDPLKYSTGTAIYQFRAIGGVGGAPAVPVAPNYGTAFRAAPPTTAQLSREDCRGIQAIYSAANPSCRDTFTAAGVPTATCPNLYAAPGPALAAAVTFVPLPNTTPNAIIGPGVPGVPVPNPTPGGPIDPIP